MQCEISCRWSIVQCENNVKTAATELGLQRFVDIIDYVDYKKNVD